MDKFPDYSVNELKRIIILRYGRVLNDDKKYEAYEFLKKKTKITGQFLPEEVYKKNIERIVETLNL